MGIVDVHFHARDGDLLQGSDSLVRFLGEGCHVHVVASEVGLGVRSDPLLHPLHSQLRAV